MGQHFARDSYGPQFYSFKRLPLTHKLLVQKKLLSNKELKIYVLIKKGTNNLKKYNDKNSKKSFLKRSIVTI